MPPLQARAVPPAAVHSVGYVMSSIAAAIVLAGLAGAYGFDWWLHRAATAVPAIADSGSRVARTLVGKNLTIPTAWLREAPSPTPGFLSQIELRVGLPLGHDG